MNNRFYQQSYTIQRSPIRMHSLSRIVHERRQDHASSLVREFGQRHVVVATIQSLVVL